VLQGINQVLSAPASKGTLPPVTPSAAVTFWVKPGLPEVAGSEHANVEVSQLGALQLGSYSQLVIL
jgi:hypothetical protein